MFGEGSKMIVDSRAVSSRLKGILRELLNVNFDLTLSEGLRGSVNLELTY